MIRKLRLPRQFRRWLRFAVAIAGLTSVLLGAALAPSSAEILAGIETENGRRHDLLKAYSGSRQYTLENLRFGKQAAVVVRTNYRQVEGESYTILTRSGSVKLNGIIDRVIASETDIRSAQGTARHEITARNYRVMLLGTEMVAGRNCYVLDLAPRVKDRYLIIGKAWVDAGSYGVVRIEGQFAASSSLLIGAPSISEEFVEVRGFWLPSRVRSVTSSFLLGPTELEILFSNYEIDRGGSF